MPNIRGVPYANPDTFAEGEVVSTGASIPANTRVMCLVGEGKRREILVNNAAGAGGDGLDSTYTSTSGADSRHFVVSKWPLVENRTALYKKGVLLSGVEEVISSTPILSKYDYRVDPATGRIELQGAYIVDQGGSLYTATGTNVGDGTLSTPTLIDTNAPAETWTIRCSSVRRDSLGNPIDGYGKFVVSGSTSGVVLDGYGKPVVWMSDGVLRNNGILSFSISEGATPFDVGDTFTIIVDSQQLKAGDDLIVEYICSLEINDFETFTDLNDVYAKHGLPSTSNTISLGAQLAFANGAPAIMCLQAAPSIPRRQMFTLIESATGGATVDDLMIALPEGVIPNFDSDIKFFSIDAITGEETQFLPNKIDFYNPTYEASPVTFINTASPYSYTVVEQENNQILAEGEDLVIVPGSGNTAIVSSDSVEFNLSHLGAGITLKVWGSSDPANNDTFTITAVADGKLNITGSAPLSGDTDLHFEVLSNAGSGYYILLTSDFGGVTGVLTAGVGLKVGVIDNRDATFYDAGWVQAFTALEAVELDILVPLPTQTISAIQQTAMQHCLKMSRIKFKKERVLFTGAISGLTPDNVTGVEPAAVEDLGILEGIQGDDPTELLAGNIEDLTNYSVSSAFGTTYRCLYTYPDQIVVNVSGSNTIVHGMYLAPAIAGLCAATGDITQPLTNKTLAGFSILRSRLFTDTVAEQITRSGITLVEPVLGGGRIVWGKTTSKSGFPEEEEPSIVFIRDYVAKNARLATRGFVGKVADDTFGTSLETRVFSFLDGIKTAKIITSYRDVTVRVDSTEPRQWNIRFGIRPPYPVNWIYIKFDIGTSAA